MTVRDAASLALDLAAARAVEADVPLQMDEDAFRGFYDRTARQVWAYLHRLTGDPHAADDLLQETYYRFLKATVRLESDEHRRHYLFRVATNLAHDRFRRRRVRPIEVADADVDTVAATVGGASLDGTLHVSQALAKLGRRERAMIWLAYAHGSSHEEIARVMGVRTGSVKTLLLRARRKFAALLGGHGGAS
jgi:RNA polymerase sigma-70 factor (ECF subfamily)